MVLSTEVCEMLDRLPWDILPLLTSPNKVEGPSPYPQYPKFMEVDWEKVLEMMREVLNTREKARLSMLIEGTPASPNTLECKVSTAVEGITLDNSDVKVKTKPIQPDKDGLFRVAIVNKHNLLGQVSDEMAAHIKDQLLAALQLAIRDGIFIPTFENWNHTYEILRITCMDINSLDWLSKAVDRIPETVHTKFQVIQADRIPNLNKISFSVPDAKVEEMTKVIKILAGQNGNLKVNSWCVFHKESCHNGSLLIVAGTVDEDVAAIEAQNRRIFYQFSTVRVTIHSPNDSCPSTSTMETKHNCRRANPPALKSAPCFAFGRN